MATDPMTQPLPLRRALLTLAALACNPLAALAQSTAPAAATGAGAGYADPKAAPVPHPAPVDANPVLRGPSVDTLATVRLRGVLRVSVVQVPPMVMLDRGGRHVGYSVDLARRLASDLGVQLQLIESSWPAVIPALLQGETDLILSGLWMSVPRALVVNFTQPTAQEGLYLLARHAQAGLRKTLAQFNQPGVTIVVPQEPVQQQVAQARFPQARRVVTDGDPLQALASGRAQAALLATLSPQALVALAPKRWYLPSAEPLAQTSAAIAVRKGDADWLSFLNTWLTIQRDQGWLDERARHWAVSTEGFQ